MRQTLLALVIVASMFPVVAQAHGPGYSHGAYYGGSWNSRSVGITPYPYAIPAYGYYGGYVPYGYGYGYGYGYPVVPLTYGSPYFPTYTSPYSYWGW